MGRMPVTEEILGLKVTSTPLTFPNAQELLPEVATLLSAVGQEAAALMAQGDVKLTDNVWKLLPVLGVLSRHLSSGKLEYLSPRLLRSTTVIMTNMAGDKQVYDLSKEGERNEVFDEHPELFLPVLFFAGRVTFARFFPGNVLRGAGTPTPSS